MPVPLHWIAGVAMAQASKAIGKSIEIPEDTYYNLQEKLSAVVNFSDRFNGLDLNKPASWLNAAAHLLHGQLKPSKYRRQPAHTTMSRQEKHAVLLVARERLAEWTLREWFSMDELVDEQLSVQDEDQDSLQLSTGTFFTQRSLIPRWLHFGECTRLTIDHKEIEKLTGVKNVYVVIKQISDLMRAKEAIDAADATKAEQKADEGQAFLTDVPRIFVTIGIWHLPATDRDKDPGNCDYYGGPDNPFLSADSSTELLVETTAYVQADAVVGGRCVLHEQILEAMWTTQYCNRVTLTAVPNLETESDRGLLSRLVPYRISENDMKISYVGAHYRLLDEWEVFIENKIPLTVLLYGRPGCGKTTLSMEVMKRFSDKRSLIIPNSVFAALDYHAFWEITNAMKPDIIVVDDVDRAPYSKLEEALPKIDRHNYKVPLTIFTANSVDRIPPALRRPDRIDYQYHIETTRDSMVRVLTSSAKRFGVSLDDIAEETVQKIAEHIAEKSPVEIDKMLRRVKLFGWDNYKCDLDVAQSIAHDYGQEEEIYRNRLAGVPANTEIKAVHPYAEACAPTPSGGWLAENRTLGRVLVARIDSGKTYLRKGEDS